MNFILFQIIFSFLVTDLNRTNFECPVNEKSLTSTVKHKNGIFITAKPNTQILSSIDGKVASVIKRKSKFNTYILIVKNGKTAIVYSNLSKINVKQGDKVGTGNLIGVLEAESQILDFQIWEKTKALDPTLYFDCLKK